MSLLRRVPLSTVVIACAIALCSLPSHAHAATAYNNADLIDNATFINAGTMQQSDIQAFLNSKGGALASQTFPTPNNGMQPASWIISYASLHVGLNPQTIMATMEKEESLITNPSPDQANYDYAMGYKCPDSGSCTEAGFYDQAIDGSWQLRFDYERANGNSSYWTAPDGTQWGSPSITYPCSGASRYYSTGLYPGNTVSFMDDSGTVYATFTIANAATAALYCYTPHAYPGSTAEYYSGSYNFVYYFNLWWPQLSVIQEQGGNRLYIDEGSTDKRWIPSPDVLDAWGLNTYTIQVLSSGAFDALPELPAISRLVSTSYAVYFMDNGQRHWVWSQAIGFDWGLDTTTAVRTADYTIQDIPEGNRLSEFAQSTDSSDGRVWLMDVGMKHYVPSTAVLNDWGFNLATTLTYISPDYLNTKTTAADATNTVSANGTTYRLDLGQPYSLSPTMATLWGATSPVAINTDPLNQLPSAITGTQFIQQNGDSKVYLADAGSLRYVSTMNTLQNWGFSNNLTTLSPVAVANFSTGASAPTYIAQDSSGNVYVLDGQKHYVPDTNTLNAWTTTNQIVPSVSTALLSLLPSGGNIGTIIQARGDGRVFTLDQAQLLYIPSAAILDAWGYGHQSTISPVNASLTGTLPTGSPASTVVSTGGTTYLLNAGTAYPASSAIATQWGLPTAQAVGAATVARLAVGASLTPFASIGPATYLMNGGNKTPVGSFGDAYGVNSSNTITLQSDYYPTSGSASPLIQSTDPTAGQVYMMNGGQKYYIDSLDKLQTLGYGSVIGGIARISPAALAALPGSSTIGDPLLVTTAGAGIAVLTSGGYLAFGSSSTLQAWLGSQTPLMLSASEFNLFHVVGTASQLVRGPDGKVYFIQNGTKCYITTPAAYAQGGYSSYPLINLPQYTLDLIPNGSPIS